MCAIRQSLRWRIENIAGKHHDRHAAGTHCLRQHCKSPRLDQRFAAEQGDTFDALALARVEDRRQQL